MSRFRGSVKAAAITALVILACGLFAVRSVRHRRQVEAERAALDLARRCAVELAAHVGRLERTTVAAAAAFTWGGPRAWLAESETWTDASPGFALLLAPDGVALAAAGRAPQPSAALFLNPRTERPAIERWRVAGGETFVTARQRLPAGGPTDAGAMSVVGLPEAEAWTGAGCVAAGSGTDRVALVVAPVGVADSPFVEPVTGVTVALGPGATPALTLRVDPVGVPLAPLLAVLTLSLLAAATIYGWEAPSQRLELALAEHRRQLEQANRSWLGEVERRRRAEQEISMRDSRDDLTPLSTRADLVTRLERGLEQARAQSDFTLAVVSLAVDRFKNVNESLGHGGGDELIAHLGRRLWAAARPEGEPARVGGGRFAVVLYDVGTDERALQVAERIRLELSQAVSIRGHEIFPTFSVGVFVSRLGLDRAESALLKAEVAMGSAKAAGGEQVAMFDASMMERAGSRLQLESDLRRAFERGEFELQFQPVMRLDSGAFVGLEALVRWRHGIDGLIMPDQFIPLAEETGLILQITQFVLAEGVRQLAEWRKLSPEMGNLYLSVNLSSRDLEDPDLLLQVDELLTTHQLPPGSLRMEVTESGLIADLDRAAERLDALHRLEIPLLLDDFGTGYSSLSYLHRLPFDYVKIDRSFILPLASPQGDHEIVRAIIDLTHCFGMQAIAEGIESSGEAGVLRSLGCEFGQGYHYSRPLAAADVVPLVRAGPISAG